MQREAEGEIRDLEAERLAAMAAGDVEVLRRLCHDDLIYTHSSGGTDSKATFLERLQNGSLRYLRLDLEVRLVRVVGGTAVALEVMDASVLLQDAAREIRSLGLAVWTRDADQWRFLAYHPLPQQ